MDPFAGTTVSAGPRWGCEGFGQGGSRRGQDCARRAVRARIPPVGVAELKCIWPPGLARGGERGYF